MIEPKKGGLYRTNCGAVVHFPRYPTGGLHLSAGPMCPFEQCGEFTEEMWNYRKGIWCSEEHNKDFHLHIKEEILP